MAMQITPALANAAGMDAGNRSMRAAGRTTWSRADYNAACAETHRLMMLLPWYRDAQRQFAKKRKAA